MCRFDSPILRQVTAPKRGLARRGSILPIFLVGISASISHPSWPPKGNAVAFPGRDINISESGAAAAILRTIREWLDGLSNASRIRKIRPTVPPSCHGSLTGVVARPTMDESYYKS
jgi:hypothetical protein